MQTVNQLLPQIKNQVQTDTQKTLQKNLHNDSQTSSECLSKPQIASLFAGWKKLYRSKIKDEDWGADTLVVWHIALNDLGMTQDEFNHAKRKSLSLSWPPTAPADFVALARDGQHSEYPDIRQAYKDAANQNYPHEVIHETAKRVGFWELRTQAEAVTYKVWQKVYPEVCSEHSQGTSFKLPEAQQIEHKHIPASPDSPVMSEWEKLKQQFLGKRGASCEQ